MRTIISWIVPHSMLLSFKTICSCCSNRHLWQSLTQNSRLLSLHESHHWWMSSPALDKRNLLQPSLPLLGKVKTAVKGCDFHRSSAGFPNTSSCDFGMQQTLLTKGHLQTQCKLLKHISAYCILFQPIKAYSILFQHIPDYSS